MINKKYLWIVFGLMILAQLFVPLQMIWGSEKTIAEGREFKFITTPVDPVDPFRGKFIRLRYEMENRYHHLPEGEHLEPNQKVYVTIEEDDEGFARAVALSSEPPGKSVHYIKAMHTHTNSKGTMIDLNFDRFFMEESLAKPAEDLVRSLRSDSLTYVYATVSVFNGNSILNDVMVNDKPIADVVRENIKE